MNERHVKWSPVHRFQRWSLAVAISLLALAPSSRGEAQPWSGGSTLGVQIRDSKGAVAGAVVEIRQFRPEGGVGPEARRTDARGQVNFVSLAPGRWNLEIKHPDYLAFIASVQVESGKKPEILSQFLEASGPGRGTFRIKFLRSAQQLGEVIPGTALDDSAPTRPTSMPAPQDARTTTGRPSSVEPEDRARIETRSAPSEVVEEPETSHPEKAGTGSPPKLGTEETTPKDAPSTNAPSPTASVTPVQEDADAVDSAHSPSATGAPVEARREAEPQGSAKAARSNATPAAEQPEAPPAPNRPEKPAASPVPEVPSPISSAAAPKEAPAQAPLPPPTEASSPAAGPAAGPAGGSAPESAAGLPAASPPAAPRPAPTAPPEPEVPAASPSLAPILDVPQPLPDPLPAASAPEAAPAPEIAPAPADLTAYKDRTCFDCKPGEWAVAARAEVSGTEPCRSTAAVAVRRALRDVAAVASEQLADFAGPLPDSIAEFPLAAASTAARNTLAPYLDSASSCRFLAVVVPKDARFTGFRFQAADAQADGDCTGAEECEIGAARFLFSPIVARGAGASIVYTLFENTARRPRTARMTAFFLPAGGWAPR